MRKTPMYPESKISLESTNNTKKEPTRIYFQRRNSDGTLFFKDKAPSYQPVHRKDNRDDKQITLAKDDAQRILNHESRSEMVAQKGNNQRLFLKIRATRETDKFKLLF